MSEGVPIGRFHDPDGVEAGRRPSSEADRLDAYTGHPDDDSGEDETPSAEADREEGYAREPLDEQVDRDVREAEEAIERLRSER
jgi:hypothetical protein